MTDKQFEKIKKGLQFHSEGGIDNLCTMTETTLRAILDDATKELEAQLESERDLPAIAYMQGAEKQKKKDEEELKKWKDEWQGQVQKATDEGYARTLQTMQLSKAKELLKKWVELYKPKLEGYPITPIQVDTEHFLNSEVEK